MKYVVLEGKRIGEKDLLREIGNDYPGKLDEVSIKYKRGNISIHFPEKDFEERHLNQLAKNMDLEVKKLSKVRSILGY